MVNFEVNVPVTMCIEVEAQAKNYSTCEPIFKFFSYKLRPCIKIQKKIQKKIRKKIQKNFSVFFSVKFSVNFSVFFSVFFQYSNMKLKQQFNSYF